jgi:hypothetical protein
VLVALGLGLLALGLYAYSIQLEQGDIVTGMRDPGRGGAAWGLYISLYVYLVGVSFAGIAVASIARLFKLHVLEPVTRLAELLTIASLIAGATAVLSDLGRADHGLTLLPALARPSSPFYGTFTLVVAGYLFSSVVAFFVTGRRDAARMVRDGPRALRWFYRAWAALPIRDGRARAHGRSTFWLAITILPLLCVRADARKCLRHPGGAPAAVPFRRRAFSSSPARREPVLILAAVILRRMLSAIRIPDSAICWLGGFLRVLARLPLLHDRRGADRDLRGNMDRHVAHQIVTTRVLDLVLGRDRLPVLGFFIPFPQYPAPNRRDRHRDRGRSSTSARSSSDC